MGREKLAHQQLIKVNKWTQEQVNQHILESFETYKERSKYEWTLDLSILTEEPYNLEIKTGKKRIFEVQKYKKKRRKKKAAAKRKAGKRPPKRK
jgi:hypothetical protein